MSTRKPVLTSAPMMLLLGAGVAGASAVRAAYRADLRDAQTRLSGQTRMVDTTAGPIEVAESGEGPPALVVHGMAGGFDMGLRIGRDVLGDGFRIIAPSRFGYLGTPMPADATLDSQADALAELLDKLGVPTAAVVAVSAGAQSTTRLALRHPERVSALVLITPALHLPPPPEGADAGPPDFVFDYLFAVDFPVWVITRLAPTIIARVAGVPPSLVDQVTPEDRKKFVDWFFPASPRRVGLAHDVRTILPTAPDLPIERLQMPLMLVSAEDDPFWTAEVVRYSAERLPSARVLMFESGGHVLLGQDDRIRDEVRAFLDAPSVDEGRHTAQKEAPAAV